MFLKVKVRKKKNNEKLSVETFSIENLKAHVEEVLSGNLEPHMKSEPVPEEQGDLKVAVGKNFKVRTCEIQFERLIFKKYQGLKENEISRNSSLTPTRTSSSSSTPRGVVIASRYSFKIWSTNFKVQSMTSEFKI